MTHTTNSTNRSRMAILSGTAVIAIAAIVYFSFFYPPTPSNEVSGTIGAVKKYRSEQITDKDVTLSSQQSDAITAEMAADQEAANQLAATAASFANTYRELDAKMTLDKATKAQFERTIAVLERSTQITLQRTQSPTYDKSAAAQGSYDKSAGQSSLQKTSSQSATMDNAAKQSFERTSRSTFDRNMVITLDRSIKTLDARTKEVASRPWSGRGKMSFDKSTGLEMRQKLADLEKSVASYEKSLQVVLENRAGATVDNKAKEDLQNRQTIDNKVK